MFCTSGATVFQLLETAPSTAALLSWRTRPSEVVLDVPVFSEDLIWISDYMLLCMMTLHDRDFHFQYTLFIPCTGKLYRERVMKIFRPFWPAFDTVWNISHTFPYETSLTPRVHVPQFRTTSETAFFLTLSTKFFITLQNVTGLVMTDML
jgi:hypothetical protein